MKNRIVQGRQASRGFLFSFVIGMIAVIVSYRAGTLLGLFETFWGWGFGALCFLLAATSIGLLYPNSSWTCVFVMQGAIPFAVFADATYDFSVNHIDRNLFPFEIVFWWIFTPLPTLIGYGAGRMVSKIRRGNFGRVS